MPRLIPEVDLPRYAFGGVVATDNSSHRPPSLKANVPYNIFESPQSIRHALRSFGHLRSAVDISLAATPPPAPICDYPGNLGWGNWLSALPEDGGATDVQQRELLQWNIDEMLRLNREQGPDLLVAHEQFTADLEDAVHNERIAPKLLERWCKVGQRATMYIDGPLTTRPDTANTYRDFSTIRFSAGFTQSVATHEFTHLSGSLYSLYLNEAAAEYLTKALTDKMNISAYLGHAILLEDLLCNAGVSSQEFSHLFAGKSSRANERALRRHVRKRSGADLLGEHHNEVRRLSRQISEDFSDSESLALTAMQIMRRKRTYGTDEEIVQRAAPDLDAGQIAYVIKILQDHL